MKLIKIAFFDRDGTIIKDYPDEQWKNIRKPEFIEGSFVALHSVLSHGYKIIIVTNQYLIGEKIISQKAYEEFNNLFLSEMKHENVEVLDIFHCPHARKENCNCCKPNPGLLQKAFKKYQNIEFEKSFLVGDSICDMELAKHFNLKFYGIGLECQNRLTAIKDLKNYLIEER